jgi:hypothetical protein
MTIECCHHRRLSTRVDMLGLLAALILAGAVIQSGHAQIYCEAFFLIEALDGADLSRQF